MTVFYIMTGGGDELKEYLAAPSAKLSHAVYVVGLRFGTIQERGRTVIYTGAPWNHDMFLAELIAMFGRHPSDAVFIIKESRERNNGFYAALHSAAKVAGVPIYFEE